MAWTIVNEPTVMGNKNVRLLKVTADSATFTIQTGLGVIDNVQIFRSSMASASNKIAVNSNTSGVASMGVLGVTGCTAGDEFYATVFGHG